MLFRNTICYCYDIKIQYLTVFYTMEMGPCFVCFLLKKWPNGPISIVYIYYGISVKVTFFAVRI